LPPALPKSPMASPEAGVGGESDRRGLLVDFR